MTANGFQLNNAAVLSILALEQYLLFCCEEFSTSYTIEDIRNFLPAEFPCACAIGYDRDISMSFVDIFIKTSNDLGCTADCYTPSHFMSRIWILNNLTSYLEGYPYLTKIPQDSPLELLSHYQLTWKGNLPLPPIQWEHYDPVHFPIAIQIFNPNEGGDSLFAQVLREVLEPAPEYDRNDIWIPFDMEERKKKFPKAFRELKVFMDHIEKYGVE